MAKYTVALEDALRYTLTEANLPSAYPDFESLTREIVRRMAPYAVIIDRNSYVALTRDKSLAGSNELNAAVARYKAHNDRVEASLKQRSNPPPAFVTTSKGK